VKVGGFYRTFRIISIASRNWLKWKAGITALAGTVFEQQRSFPCWFYCGHHINCNLVAGSVNGDN